MFSPQTFEFMMKNCINNSREWFLQHRGDYDKYVLNPLIDLAVRLAPTVLKADPMIVTEPKIDKTISRIYRDVRFSPNGQLYRDGFWLSFRRDKKMFPCYPEFFFVVTPNVFFYGCGYYAATADAMQSARELILAGDPSFAEALKAYDSRRSFELDGECYKKSRYPQQPERLRMWLDRKNFLCIRKGRVFSELYSDGIADDIADVFEQVAPIYRFFVRAEQVKGDVK